MPIGSTMVVSQLSINVMAFSIADATIHANKALRDLQLVRKSRGKYIIDYSTLLLEVSVNTVIDDVVFDEYYDLYTAKYSIIVYKHEYDHIVNLKKFNYEKAV